MPENARRQIGQRLKMARELAKLTQEDVAADLLCSRQAVSSWEKGRTLPSLVEFKSLATLYGVSTDQVLYGVQSVSAECADALSRAAGSKDLPSALNA